MLLIELNYLLQRVYFCVKLLPTSLVSKKKKKRKEKRERDYKFIVLCVGNYQINIANVNNHGQAHKALLTFDYLWREGTHTGISLSFLDTCNACIF